MDRCMQSSMVHSSVSGSSRVMEVVVGRSYRTFL